MLNIELTFHDIYEKFPIHRHINLYFDKLESAARLQFNWTLQEYIMSAVDMAIYLRDAGCFDRPGPTELRQMMTDAAKHGRLFAENLEKIAKWYLSVGSLEPERTEFLKSEWHLRSWSEQLRKIAISFEEYCQSGLLPKTQGHVGRKKNRALQFLVGHAYIAYREAGGKVGVYWKDGLPGKHSGAFLDMTGELLRQACWQYRRETLGAFIYRYQAGLKREYSLLVRRPT